jgi:hypothetical protein
MVMDDRVRAPPTRKRSTREAFMEVAREVGGIDLGTRELLPSLC